MNQMDEKEALKMMDLNEDASKDDISRRYGILTRKFRTIKTDENGYTIEDITNAYNLLMGITYSDKKEEERQKALREHPPLLARILKKDPVKLENFFHYYKIHILIGIGLVILIFFTVRSCINRVDPDFTMVLFGKIYVEDEDPLQEDISRKLPELNAPEVQLLFSNESDPQYEYAIQMKLVAMISANGIDILLTDQSTFNQLSAQGALLSLEEYKETLPFSDESYVKGAEVLDENENGEPVLGPEKLYGVDITEMDFVKDNAIYGDKIIAAVVVNSTKIDQAISYLQKLE